MKKFKIIVVTDSGNHYSTSLEGYSAETLADQHFREVVGQDRVVFAVIHETYESGQFGERARYVREK